jgi:hypothetical protein
MTDFTIPSTISEQKEAETDARPGANKPETKPAAKPQVRRVRKRDTFMICWCMY